MYIFVLTGAAFVWSFGLLILGQVLGEHWWDAVKFLRHNVYIGVIAIVGALVITCVYVRLERKAGATRVPALAGERAASASSSPALAITPDSFSAGRAVAGHIRQVRSQVEWRGARPASFVSWAGMSRAATH